MRVTIAIMPCLFVAVAAAGRDELVQNGGQVILQPRSNSIVPSAAVLPTLKTLTVPVWTVDEFTTPATCSVRSCMSPWPLVVMENLFLIGHNPGYSVFGMPILKKANPGSFRISRRTARASSRA